MPDNGHTPRPRRALPPSDETDQPTGLNPRVARPRRGQTAPEGAAPAVPPTAPPPSVEDTGERPLFRDETAAGGEQANHDSPGDQTATKNDNDSNDDDSDADQTRLHPAVTDDSAPAAGSRRAALGRWRDRVAERSNTAAVSDAGEPARDVVIETNDDPASGPDTRSTPTASAPASSPSSSSAPASTPASPPSPSSPWSRAAGAGQRMDTGTKRALVVAGIAAALVLVIAVGYALWSIGRPNDNVAAPQSAVPTQTKREVLTDAGLLTDAQARLIDPKAGWKVALTQDGTNADSPQPMCIDQNASGQAIPVATKLRTLTSASQADTAALHQADAYANADDARQVFEARLGQLGTCADTPAYLQSGILSSGIGNQSGGVVAVLQNEKAEYHTVLLSRTGKVVNVIDVVQSGKAAGFAGLAKASAAVVNNECTNAVGLCSFKPAAALGTPPAGGDQPGFLAANDLPRITPGQGDWGGTSPATDIQVVGSQCESIDFATVQGPTARKARTYLLRNDSRAPANLGVDEVLLTMPTAKDAAALVTKLTDNVAKCPDRALTAKVSERTAIKGSGDNKVAVQGTSFRVTQRTNTGTLIFRVAMVQADKQVIYLFLPADAKFDLTDRQWTDLALRAGQRTSQVR